jgi:lipopolysaccharide exporter
MKVFRPGRTWSEKVVHAGFWAFALLGVEQLVILCRLFVLAVLLLPRDFGLFGMALLAMFAVDTMSKTGFEQALIHKQEENTAYLDVAWTVLVIRGLALALLFCGAAPWMAGFFDEPAATPLMRALSISFVFQGFTNIGVVNFQKKLEFHKEFAFRFSGILADMVVAIVAAYLLKSAWAFVLGMVAGDLTRLGVSYLIHPFRPRLRFALSEAKELFDYGMWMLFVGMTLFVGQNGASVAIGKIVGATALGYFQMASRVPNVVVRRLGMSISDVAFPAYAELQGSSDLLRAAYQRIAGVSAIVLMPAAVGIVCVGHDFTRICLGPKWMPMVPALILLSVASLVVSIGWTGRPAFMGGGRPQVVFHMQVAMAATILVCIYPLCALWGINGAAWAMVLSGVSALGVWYVNIRRQLGIAWKELNLIFTPPMIASALMAGALYGMRVLTLPLLPQGHVWDILWLLCLILAGAAVYFALITLFQRWLPDYRPLKGITKALKD